MGRTQGKNTGRTCQGQKTDGSPCTAYALMDSDLCRVHDPRTRDEALRKLRDGKAGWLADPSRRSKRSKPRVWDVGKFLGRKPIDAIIESVPMIQSQADLMEYMCEVAPLLASGKVTAEQIRVITVFIQVWEKILSKQGGPFPPILEAEMYDRAAPAKSESDSAESPQEEGMGIEGDIAELEKNLGRPALLSELDLGDESDDREQVGGEGDGVEPEGPPDPP